ncbi:zinc finger Ran-binding domain-containing protein 2 [Clonorchis sinensis]|uniref:Zinc finger Ran-binding domain-containing protein 2 n=1 Tax=Clonorchis sinensis TaxID=79923 RepID=G7Y5I8_CLOSI|nr:zinc finger Ran-binding domain-containing protein 2 [Clonorchis sinensis]
MFEPLLIDLHTELRAWSLPNQQGARLPAQDKENSLSRSPLLRCGNINWARRSTCNVCNNPRVNVLGQRTGYGGGFMERDEVVEYKRRGSGASDDSDDEFDEFGRKKKKFRKHSTTQEDEASVEPSITDPIHSEHRAQQNNDSEIDEEEEESGDDADLSKYDIWGADDGGGGDGDGDTKEGAQKPSVDNRQDNTRAASSEDESGLSGSDTESDSDSSSASSSSSSASSTSSKNRSRSGSKTRSPGDHDDEGSDNEVTHRPTRRTPGGRDRSRFDLAAVQPCPS